MPLRAQQKVTVPTGPAQDAASIPFRDSHYGVRFEVPPGWNLTRKDREVSTFRLDARSAPRGSELRGVASMGFNPFPHSVLSGALVYFSVAKHSNDRTCAAQATGGDPIARVPGTAQGEPENMDVRDDDVDKRPNAQGRDPQRFEAENIGGMEFLHGHDEHGYMCVEGRDEVYTAYRKGSCYRFDLTLNTFCAISSGAAELSREQFHSIEAQMAGILSTVSLDWEKAGPQPVAVPEIAPTARPKPSPRHPIPTVPAGHKPVLGTGA